MSVPVGWNTGNDKRDTAAVAATHAIRGFFMVTGNQLTMKWGARGLAFLETEGDGYQLRYQLGYDDLELWVNKADACPFMDANGYVSTMILQHLLVWWEANCDAEHDHDAAMGDLSTPDYEDGESSTMTPEQEAFITNAYQDKVEQGEP